MALARLPLIADSLARGDLVEVLPGQRVGSPWSYWLVPGARSAQRPEIKAFTTWLLAQAEATREAVAAPAGGRRLKPGARRRPAR